MVGWRGRHETMNSALSGVHRTVQRAHRQKVAAFCPKTIWVVEGYKSHPIQLTHGIHWSISYTRVGIHSYLLEQHFYTHQSLTSATKREIRQERATRVRLVIVPCENHWEKVCATSCDHLSVEFWLSFIVKLARAPYLCGWPCGDFGLLLTKKKENSPVLVTIGERERVEKDSSLVYSSMGIRFLVNRTLVKQITRVTCVYCLWFVCLLPL